MAVIQEQRDVSGFDEIRMEMTGDILLEQGDQEKLVIEADESLLPRLKSDVVNERLELGLKHWYDFIFAIPNTAIHYHITVRNLRGVIISGSGKLHCEQLETDRLRLRVSGSGKLELNELTASDLELDFSGSAKARLAGTVKQQEIKISGSGDVRAEDLDSQQARVRISGSGNLRLRVQERLDVRISGSGSVRYHGQPAIEQHISGSGSIKAIKE